MPIHRCPRCRAQDITIDAHPTRIVNNGRLVPVLVCRNCYRQAELELRIACEAADIPLEPMPIRDGQWLASAILASVMVGVTAFAAGRYLGR